MVSFSLGISGFPTFVPCPVLLGSLCLSPSKDIVFHKSYMLLVDTHFFLFSFFGNIFQVKSSL